MVRRSCYFGKAMILQGCQTHSTTAARRSLTTAWGCTAKRSSLIGAFAGYGSTVVWIPNAVLTALLICLAPTIPSRAEAPAQAGSTGKVAAPPSGDDPESADIVVALRDGRFYSPRAFLDACNDKLGTKYDRANVADRDLELSGVEKAALLIADDLGVLKIRFEVDRFILSIPSRREGRAHVWLERLLQYTPDAWPSDLGLHVPDDFQPSRRTVLLIHGLESRAASMRPLQTAFGRWGVQAYSLTFRTMARLLALVPAYGKISAS